MAEAATKPLTFEEFVDAGYPGRCELVNGRVEELMSPKVVHGWTYFRFPIVVGVPALEADPGGYWGGEVDIPTVPHCGRRPDFCYYASSDASGVDLPANRVYRPPTLAVEILSEGDENRDLVDKRDEYARAGIPHYWILDPVTRTITTLVMRGNAYEVERVFGSGERFTSSLFPGLSVPVAALFPP